MKVIMYMAINANGLIAKNNDDTSWISKEEWDSYATKVKESGNLIVGRRTYHILVNQPEFEELGNIKLIILSTEKFQTKSENHVIASSTMEALEILKEFNQVIIAGGGITNACFLEKNLVDEIYIDIEPIIFSKGIPLCYGKEFETKLELIEIKQLSKDEVQLHYKILK